MLSGAGLGLRRAKPVGEPAESGPQGRVEARRAGGERSEASLDTTA